MLEKIKFTVRKFAYIISIFDRYTLYANGDILLFLNSSKISKYLYLCKIQNSKLLCKGIFSIIFATELSIIINPSYDNEPI